MFTGYLHEVINQARIRFPDQDKLSDLEIMASLQHQGGATGLIDFTESPWVALWFACQPSRNDKGDEMDGKVVAVNLDQKNIREVASVEVLEKKLDYFFPGGDGGLWFWRPGHDDRRMIAQQSLFVFGAPELEDEFVIPMPEVIPAKAKSEILAILSNMGISEKTLFADFPGFAAANAQDKDYRNFAGQDLPHGCD